MRNILTKPYGMNHINNKVLANKLDRLNDIATIMKGLNTTNDTSKWTVAIWIEKVEESVEGEYFISTEEIESMVLFLFAYNSIDDESNI